MGDMADMLIDQMFDDIYGDEEDGDGPPMRTIKCRCCGVTGLVWGQCDNGKYRLHDQEGALHACAVNPLKETLPKPAPPYTGPEFAPLPAGFKMSDDRKVLTPRRKGNRVRT